MSNIFVTSDLHFNHNKDFIYKDRGFSSIEEHDEKLIENWNSLISKDDLVYILGDLMLGDYQEGMKKLKRLNGKFFIILGNHDTSTREGFYYTLDNLVEVAYATRMKKNGYNFYLSHYPTITTNLNETKLKAMTLNLHGHTHSKQIFEGDCPFRYNVALDAHNMYPVRIEQIIADIQNKFIKQKEKNEV